MSLVMLEKLLPVSSGYESRAADRPVFITALSRAPLSTLVPLLISPPLQSFLPQPLQFSWASEAGSNMTGRKEVTDEHTMRLVGSCPLTFFCFKSTGVKRLQILYSELSTIILIS